MLSDAPNDPRRALARECSAPVAELQAELAMLGPAVRALGVMIGRRDRIPAAVAPRFAEILGLEIAIKNAAGDARRALLGRLFQAIDATDRICGLAHLFVKSEVTQ